MYIYVLEGFICIYMFYRIVNPLYFFQLKMDNKGYYYYYYYYYYLKTVVIVAKFYTSTDILVTFSGRMDVQNVSLVVLARWSY